MDIGRPPDIDLGSGVQLYFIGWHPDRDINPHYEGIADCEKYTAYLPHKTPSGDDCAAAILFESETQQKLQPKGPAWKVISWEPLTVEPSILCLRCGKHGFIKQGKWQEV